MHGIVTEIPPQLLVANFACFEWWNCFFVHQGLPHSKANCHVHFGGPWGAHGTFWPTCKAPQGHRCGFSYGFDTAVAGKCPKMTTPHDSVCPNAIVGVFLVFRYGRYLLPRYGTDYGVITLQG